MAEFTCTACGGTFDQGWSDDAAAAECLETFGTPHQSDDAVLCDDCYRAFMSADDDDHAALARRILKRLSSDA